MSFTLTRAHLDSLLDPTKAGDMEPFLNAIDPDVEWRVGASDLPGKGHTGVYNLATWKAKVPPKLAGVYGYPVALQHSCEVVEISGNKAIVEDVSKGVMKNGQTCENRNCLVLEFSVETGRINTVRAYTDTAVMVEAKRVNAVPVEDDQVKEEPI